MYQFKIPFVISNIVVVGAGGTGSRLMPGLAQLVRTCMRQYNPLAWKNQIPIWVVDGDIVEPKNLTRQHFVAQDVGQNKAVVLAERYSSAFGVPIHAHPEMWTEQTTGFLSDRGSVPLASILQYSLLILAVDSPEARRFILSSAMAHSRPNDFDLTAPNMVVIDAGNEDSFGQVTYFTNTVTHWDGGSRYKDSTNFRRYPPPSGPVELNYLPMPVDHYVNLGRSAQEQSCAELPQTLAINQMMATMILGAAQNMLLMKPVNYHTLRFDLVHGASTELITKHSLTNAIPVSLDSTLFVRTLCDPASKVDLARYMGLTIKAETAKYTAMGLMINEEGRPVPIPPKPAPPPPPPPPLVATKDEPLPVKIPLTALNPEAVPPAPAPRRRATRVPVDAVQAVEILEGTPLNGGQMSELPVDTRPVLRPIPHETEPVPRPART